MHSVAINIISVLLCLAALLVSGCINTVPEYRADVTPEPTREPTPAPTAEPTPEPTATPAPEPTQQHVGAIDALGVPISGAEHYMRYVTFTEMIVYEENGGTFLDGIAVNSYPEPLVCAVSIVYRDDDGAELARAQLKTRDGQYLLVLEPGETVVYADILTDMTLVGLEFTLEYDMSTGVHPR